MPLEIGHDRRASGYRATINATPIPPVNKVLTPIPPPTAGYSLDDVLTKSSIPLFNVESTQYQPLVTTIPLIPGAPTVEPTIPGLPAAEKFQAADAEEEPGEEVVPEVEEPEKTGCDGPQNLCPRELNQILYRLLTSEIEPQINCPGDRFELYQNGDPMEADFTYKAVHEFIHRETNDAEFTASSTVKLRYSQWGPAPSENAKLPVRLLLLHDALDSRKGWWCCQKLLSPFIDTLSVDLLGSGESSRPRGINIKSSTDNTEESTTELVPWSYEFHAQYLIEMVRVIWPTEKVYVAGVGWGAQIAITMASLSDVIAGVIMVNPPSLTRTIHPELAYLGIYHLARIPSDELLDGSHVSVVHLIREVLMRNLQGANSQASLSLILDQYCSLDRKRVLIDQIVSTSNFRYQELPRTDENIYGLQIENVKASVLVVSSAKDQIYPVNTSHLYPIVYYNTLVKVQTIENTGHFAQLDRPESLSEIIIDFIRQNVGVGGLKDVFLGFGPVGQPSEKKMVNGFRDLYTV